MNKILFDNSYDGKNHRGQKLNYEDLKPKQKVIVEIDDKIVVGIINQIGVEEYMITQLLTENGETIKVNKTNNFWEWIDKNEKISVKKNESSEVIDKKVDKDISKNILKQKTESKPLQEAAESQKATFPEWDIVPVSEIINPRIKKNNQ